MRDTDVGFKTTIIAGTSTNVDGLSALKGKRLALGSRDSAQAAILPIYFLKKSGMNPDQDLRITRFNVDVGKHGDTGISETQVLDAVANGSADAGAIGDQYWARVLTEHLPQVSRVRSIWTSPGYCHCNFTILSRDDYPRFAAWTEALLAMDYNKPGDRKIMDMEGLTQWIRPQLQGYGVLFEAVDELAFFSDES
jgi:ABC-type phosphate/phosphonate transport system substrate-binding protein